MIEIVRVRSLALAAALCAFTLLAACGDGDDEGAATPTAGPPGTGGVPPLDGSLFPVVLESAARWAASEENREVGVDEIR